MHAREPLKRQSATEPVSYSQNSAVSSDSLTVCQHRLTLFSSARLRLPLARARAGKQSDEIKKTSWIWRLRRWKR